MTLNRRAFFCNGPSTMVAAGLALLGITSSTAYGRREVDNTACPKCGGQGHELGILGYWDKDNSPSEDDIVLPVYPDWRLRECAVCKIKYCVWSPKLRRREGV